MATPAVWLTAHSLLIDGTLLFLFLGALYFLVRATETDGALRALVSGVFMGLAVLAKYTGVFVFPLTAAWLFLRRKKGIRWPWYVAAWAIGLAFLVAFSVVTARLYGRPHLFAASARMVHVFGWAKALIFFVFFSGATLVPLVAWPVVSPRTRVVASLVVFLLAVLFSSSLGGFSIPQAFLLALWLVTSGLFLGAFWSVRKEWVFPRDPFLFLWIVGFVAMMLIVMDWVAGRYYCLVTPAVVFAAARLVEIRWPDRARAYLRVAAVLLILFTGLLAVADDRQAAPGRAVGGQLRTAGFSGGPRHFYLGDSFTLSYLREEGWVPCFPETSFQVGDLILAKEVTMPLAWFAHRPVVLKSVAEFSYPSWLPLKVMDYRGSAGFYASVWGALPFTFSTGPWERFRVFEVVALKEHESR